MMSGNVNLLEMVQIQPAFVPASLTTAQTGDVVSMKNYRRCLVKFVKGIGTAGQDPTITLAQGTDVAFGTTKALTFTTIYEKADLTQISDVGQWTKITQAAGATYTDATAAEKALVWCIDIKAEDLDVANDYDCIRASIGDVGTASQIGYVEYILYDPVQMSAPESMPSAIIN
jgi:hypothetical protein